MDTPDEEERIHPSFASFCSIHLNRLDDACPHGGEQISLRGVLNQACSSLPETPSQTHSEVMFYQLVIWVSFRPVKQTHKINHQTGTRMKNNQIVFPMKKLLQEIM